MDDNKAVLAWEGEEGYGGWMITQLCQLRRGRKGMDDNKAVLAWEGEGSKDDNRMTVNQPITGGHLTADQPR